MFKQIHLRNMFRVISFGLRQWVVLRTNLCYNDSKVKKMSKKDKIILAAQFRPGSSSFIVKKHRQKNSGYELLKTSYVQN